MIETEGVLETDIEGVIEIVAEILALGVLDTEGDKDTDGVIEILGVGFGIGKFPGSLESV